MARQPKTPRMLTHGQVWAALDRLAERAGLSPSGLARRAGLDPTTFNKSKRVTADGRERWPSTESLAKAIAAGGSSIDHFAELIGDSPHGGQSVPLLGLAQAGNAGHFDEHGYPAGKGWDEVALSAAEEHAYALQITGDAMRPVYRDGDILLVSPDTPVRRGDRVVVKTASGELLIRELKRRTAKTIDLAPLHPDGAEQALSTEDVAWIARVIWVRQ
jgi:phage repressor protein C with HTH and peptisase S24 domain